MKIAYLISLDNKTRSGLYYSIVSKIKSFKENNPDIEIEVFNMDIKQPYLIRKVFEIFKIHLNKVYGDNTSFDGLECRNLYFNYNLFSYLRMKFNYKFDFYKEYAKMNSHYFENYDLISTHSTSPMLVAYNINMKSDIPFTITFHGTDINITPFKSDENLKLYSKIFEKSSANFFVSKTLLNKGKNINSTTSEKNYVLYNGINFNDFKRSTDKRIKALKNELNINCKVVGFVGNLVDVKNVLLLPDVFKILRSKNAKISFVVIGGGILEKELQDRFTDLNIELSYYGRVDKSEIMDYYSLMDVLVLPSKNEGLPLVLLEAMACGVSCVGSNVGGIPEAIGIENCFDLGEDFIDKVTNRMIQIINSNKQMDIDTCRFDLNNIAKDEAIYYKKIVSK